MIVLLCLDMGFSRHLRDLMADTSNYILEGKKSALLEKSELIQSFDSRKTSYFSYAFYSFAFQVSELNYTQKNKDYSKYYTNHYEQATNTLFYRAIKRLYNIDNHRIGSKNIRVSGFDKLSISWFVAWYRGIDGSLKKEAVKGKVSRFFFEKARRINSDRAKEAKDSFIKRENFQRITTRIYSDRIFPVKLRQLIFEKNNFTCQNCGRDKEQCIADNLYLEAHHILAWEDGGETCYNNGLTLCSKCNKGVHYAKVHNRKKSIAKL